MYNSEEEINLLIKDFIALTLPKEKWAHEAHLTGAIWHLMNYDFYEAICLIKSRIISYNLAVGGENTSASGYHETLTIFWMKLVALYIEKNKNKSLLEITNQFLASPLSSRLITQHFYDKERLMSGEARSIYVAPEKIELNAKTINELLVQKNN